jgi:glutaredoxin 3
MAERLLRSKGVDVETIRVDVEPGRRAEMEQRSGRRSVPQIFVGDVHVGGFMELAQLERDGRLDDLLGRRVESA